MRAFLSRPGHIALGIGALALLLVAPSTPRWVGDGHEYYAMALALLEFGSVAPTEQQLAFLESRLSQVDAPLPRDALHEGADGRLHFRHFWAYSVLASPFVWVAQQAGVHPSRGFALLNLCLFVLSGSLAMARLDRRFGVLVVAGPVVWWLDKAHTEVFVFSLLTVGFVLIGSGVWWSLVAFGVASMQYPPIGLLVPITAVLALVERRELLGDRRFSAGLAAGILAFLVHPLYSLANLGVVSPLAYWSDGPTVPTLREWGAVLWDLNIGLIPNFPFWILALSLALWLRFRPNDVRLPSNDLRVRPDDVRVRPNDLRARPDDPRARPDDLLQSSRDVGTSPGIARPVDLESTAVAVALAALLLFPALIAQNSANVNNGGTPGMSRQALWLIPAAIPLLRRVDLSHASGRLARSASTLAVASAIWCLLVFHPNRAESYQEPSWIAGFVWSNAPRLSKPLPEVFSERVSGTEPGELPARTVGCEKLLLAGGRWPAPCAPSPNPPAACREPGALCYANRRWRNPAAYSFQTVSDRVRAPISDNPQAWLPSHETTIARLLRDLRWWEMASPSMADPGSMLRAAHGVAWTARLQADGRLFVYAHAPSPDASLTLRLPEPMTGGFVDPGTGREIARVQSPDDLSQPWNLRVPSGSEGMALVLNVSNR